MSKDKDEIRRLIGEIAGRAEFEVLIGGLTDKGMDKALLFVKEVRLAKETEAAVDAMRVTGKGIDIPKVTPEMVARRDFLKAEVEAGRPVRLEAERPRAVRDRPEDRSRNNGRPSSSTRQAMPAKACSRSTRRPMTSKGA